MLTIEWAQAGGFAGATTLAIGLFYKLMLLIFDRRYKQKKTCKEDRDSLSADVKNNSAEIDVQHTVQENLHVMLVEVKSEMQAGLSGIGAQVQGTHALLRNDMDWIKKNINGGKM